ncbi:MAG: chemotaxis protein CheD [Deltaproteobacteria bacterium]
MDRDNVIKVGMADFNAVSCPDVLTTLGLGSCIGLCLYDSFTKVAGMIHIMLPYSSNGIGEYNPAKYADTGIPLLIDKMEKMGAIKLRLTAKMAGGAQMFGFSSDNDIIQIGKKNIAATKELLEKLNIRIIAEDTGGSCGRTIEFSANDGSLLIKTIGKGTQVI